MKKITISVGLFLLSFSLVLGCRQAPKASPEDPASTTVQEQVPVEKTPIELPDAKPETLAPEDGDWLLMRLPAEMPHLNPLTSSDAYASYVMSWVFDSLLDRDSETLAMKPRLAESWEISEDKLSYTFHLREGLVFSDGAPLTAEDVKFTFDSMMDPKTDSPHLRNYYKDITSCEILDPLTVRYTCALPYFRHEVMLGSLEILPKHIYEQGDFNNHPNNRNPIGSGMFILEKWDTGQQIVLKRNPKYWGKALNGLPHFDQIVYKIITDENASFQMLSRGDLDAMALRAEDWTRRAGNAKFESKFNKYEYYKPSYSYIGWNARRPIFSDKKVRRALTMLVDRESILETLYYGLAKVISGNFMPGTPEHHPTIQPHPFAPQEAINLLKEAGWTDSDGDGKLDKEGVIFKFEAMTTNSNPIAEKILTLYKEELSRVGIELVIRQMEWASLIERIDARDFDAVLMGWSMPPDPDPYQVWHSTQTEAGSNYIGFVNPEADSIIEQARVSFSREERVKLYNRFHEIVHEEQPYTFLFSTKALLAVDKRIHGVTVYPFGVEEREWFVPKAMQRYGK